MSCYSPTAAAAAAAALPQQPPICELLPAAALTAPECSVPLSNSQQSLQLSSMSGRNSRGSTAAESAAPTETPVANDRVFRETFNALVKGRGGELPVNLIGQALRMNNQCPTEAQLQQIVEDHRDPDAIDQDAMPKIDFEEFCVIMKENWKSRDELQDEINQAFATFDKVESGMIEAEDLKNWMLSLGETLEEAEVNEMIKDSGVIDGKVPYDQFAALLLEAFARPASKKPKGSAKKGSGKKKK